MLVLTRKNRESVVVAGLDGAGPLLKVTVLSIEGGKVRLGFEVDRAIAVHRWEVWERIQAESKRSTSAGDKAAPTA